MAAGRSAPERGRAFLQLPRALLLVGSSLRLRAALDEHPTRRAIRDAVAEHPGLPLNKLRETLGLGWGTLYHHVRVLEKEGSIETVATGRRRLLYVPGSAAGHVLRAQGLLEGRTARHIATTIRDHPSRSFKEILGITRESERSVYYHLKRLMEAGLVASSSSTRHYGLHATPLLHHCLARLDDARTEGAGTPSQDEQRLPASLGIGLGPR